MDLLARRDTFGQELVAFAWNEWAQLGVSAHVEMPSSWAVDPEALILLTLEVGRHEPRLFDEMLDWFVENEALLSVRRLRSFAVDDRDRQLLDGAFRWVAVHAPRTRLATKTQATWPEIQLFETHLSSEVTDSAFAAAAIVRPPLSRSGKSQSPSLRTRPNLTFQLRGLLGVGLRSELVRVATTTNAPWLTAATLSRATGYSKRNVLDVMAALADAGVVNAVVVGNEQRYSASPARWRSFLGRTAHDWPTHRDWPQLLGSARILLRTLGDGANANQSELMQATRMREAMEGIRPELSFAGIAVPFTGGPECVEADLDDVLDSLASALNRPSLSRTRQRR